MDVHERAPGQRGSIPRCLQSRRDYTFDTTADRVPGEDTWAGATLERSSRDRPEASES